MPRTVKFETRAEAGSTLHEITVRLPTYDEATEKQRRAGYDDGVFGQGCRVPVQTRLRNAIKNGKRGAALDTFAQACFMDRLNNTKAADANVVDYNSIPGLTDAQVAALEAAGTVFINKPVKK